MVQYHDEPHALWRQRKHKGRCNPVRFDDLLARISDWDLFHAFLIIDGCAAGKVREPLAWWCMQAEDKVDSRFGEKDILFADR